MENNLIKEHRPKYNTMLKDDKTYPFIKATVYEEYPRLIYSREQRRDKCKYFYSVYQQGLQEIRWIWFIKSIRYEHAIVCCQEIPVKNDRA